MRFALTHLPPVSSKQVAASRCFSGSKGTMLSSTRQMVACVMTLLLHSLDHSQEAS